MTAERITKTETAKLLTVASAISSRRITPETVEAWHAVLVNAPYRVTFEAAQEALLAHFADPDAGTAFLMPAHIVAQIRKAKQRHRELYGVHPAPPPGKRWAVDALCAPETRE